MLRASVLVLGVVGVPVQREVHRIVCELDESGTHREGERESEETAGETHELKP